MSLPDPTAKLGAILLAGLAGAGLVYVFLRAIFSGSTAYADQHSAQTSRQLEDLFLFIPPRRIAEIGWVAAATIFLLFSALFFDLKKPASTATGLILGTLFGLGAFQLPSYALVFLMERRRTRFNLQLVDALTHMSNALKAGFSINQAFETIVENGEKPISEEFALFLQQTRVGVSFNDALVNMDQRVGSDDLTLVCTSIDIARRTGGNLTEIFDTISLTIRERMRIESRVRTLTAQGRLQGIIVGGMPVILGVALTFIRPSMMIPFLTSPTGMVALAVMFVLLTLGALTIRKIIRIDV
jgi:tight adherence protein B